MKKFIGLIHSLILIFETPFSSGFLSSSWTPDVATCPPEIKQYVQSQTDTILDIRLNIGLEKDSPVLAIGGFQFQLSNKPILNKENEDEKNFTSELHIPLPGTNGPRPRLSSGAYHLNFLQDGTYVNMNGLQNVEFSEGCWEMIWRDRAAAGLIVCGLKLNQDARRNDMVLEKGNIYITFPVWSKEGLQKRQFCKLESQAKYKEFEMARDEELQKMAKSSNILMKALHYRNAVAATESMDNTGLHNMVDVPSGKDVIEIGAGLQLVQTGTVWCKSGPFRSYHQKLLGSAAVENSK